MTRPAWQGFIPLGIILILLIGAWFLGLHHFLTLEALKDHYEEWRKDVEDYPLLAPLIFIALYSAAVALSLPGGTILTLASGCLFGALEGAALSVIAATLGASLVFFATKSALGNLLRRKAGPWIVRLQQGFNDNEWSYMVALRLLPIVPFWVVNLVPALLGVRFKVFVIATFFGIMPATAVYATFGSGLSDLLAKGGDVGLHGLVSPKLIGSLVALGLLALVPAAYKQYRKVKR